MTQRCQTLQKGSTLTLVEYVSADHGHRDLCIENGSFIDGHDVLRQNRHIGEFPNRDRTYLIFLKSRVSVPEGQTR